MKKILYGLLSACFVMLGMLSVCTMTAFAEEIATEGETGGCTYTLTPNNEGEDVTYTLTISPKEGGDGKMEDYDGSSEVPWYNVSSQITELVIDDQVINIGGFAFYGCSSLESVELPEGVRSINTGGFGNCSSLESISIPESVRSIGSSAFSGCSSLESVELPESVREIYSGAFSGCSSLTSIEIPEDARLISGHIFSGCSSLTSVELPESVTSIEEAMFEDCSSLTSIELPKGVTSIASYAFEGSGLQSIELPEGVTTVGNWAFQDCSSLKSVEFSESVTTIGNWAFKGCSSLESVTIPGSVTSIGGYVFYFCEGLKSVTVCNGVTSIPDSAFENCSKLESVTIPESVTTIGKNAFRSCSSLTSVTIPVASMGVSAFSGCSSLASIEIPEGVTSIPDYAFSSCGLENVTISASVTSIAVSAFQGCYRLASITVANENPVYDSRNNCNAVMLTSENELLIGTTNTVIPNDTVSIGNKAFYTRSRLTSITIPNSVTSIGDSAFDSCTNLESVTIPKSVTSIGKNAFYQCFYLETVNVPCTWDGTLYSFYQNATLNYVFHDVDTSSSTCSNCGAAVNDWAELMGHSLTLTDEIGLNYIVALGDGAQNANTKAVFTIPSGETGTGSMTVEAVWSADKTMVVDGTTYYVFTCPVAAKQMSDIISIQLVVNGVSQLSESYSVRDYAVSVLENADKAAAHDVVKAMLNYGAYAQEYFDYNTEDLANAGYEDQGLGIDISTLQRFTPVVEGSNEVLSYAGSTLLLESQTKVRHYFKLNDGKTYSGELQLYAAPDGVTVDGTYYYYESEGVKAAELGDMASYEVVDDISINYSPLSYVTTVVATTESDLKGEVTLQNLMKALYLYYQEVVGYNGVA